MLNQTSIMGRITADPSYKQRPGEASYVKFSIAVERNYTDKDTGKRGVDFFNVVAWRSTADFVAKYFCKGKPIIINGNLQARQYLDANNVKRTAVEILAQEVYFAADSAKTSEPNPYEPPPGYDGMPFFDDPLA